MRVGFFFLGRLPVFPGLLLFLILASAPDSRAASPSGTAGSAAFIPSVTHACRPISDSMKIDGVLDEPGWKGLDTLRLFRNNDPAGGKPSVETKVLVAWSQTRLYIAFIALTKNVRGTETQHDGPLYDQDVVEMFIDPDGDSKDYVELEWNCLNTSLDYSFTGPRTGSNTAWSATGMLNAVKVMGTANKPSDVDTGMVVEISIPWTALKPFSKSPLPPRNGDSLPLDFYRIDYATSASGELIAWAPTGVADFHRPDKFGALVFSTQPVTAVFPAVRAPSHGPSAPLSPRFRTPLRADGRSATTGSPDLWLFQGSRIVGKPYTRD